MYEYKVVTELAFAESIRDGVLERTLNEHAKDGFRLAFVVPHSNGSAATFVYERYQEPSSSITL